MGMNYAQLHTPDGSNASLNGDTRKYLHTPNMPPRVPSLSDVENPAKDVGGDDDTVVEVEAKDDYLGCGGLLGRCPLISLLSFIVLGILLGIGLSQLLFRVAKTDG